jgi:hypothetical protein
MSRQEIIEKHMRQVSSRAYWLGVIAGLVFGFIAGGVVGYALSSDTTIVIPLTEGVKV